jgi:hypothetical protein
LGLYMHVYLFVSGKGTLRGCGLTLVYLQMFDPLQGCKKQSLLLHFPVVLGWSIYSGHKEPNKTCFRKLSGFRTAWIVCLF